MDEPQVADGRRARRALALMTVALLGLAVAGVIELRANAPLPAPAPPPPPHPVLTSLDWISDTAGWVVLTDPVTHRSALFGTTDAGRHWQRRYVTVSGTGGLAPSFAAQTPLSVRFLDATHGLLTQRTDPTATPTVFASDDAGLTWAPLSLPEVTAIRHGLPLFLDLDDGWVVVDGSSTTDVGVFRTDDGGRTWITEGTPGRGDHAPPGQAPPVAAGAGWFGSPLDGWLVRVDPDGGTSVIATHDGGETWQITDLPEPPGGWNPVERIQLQAPRVDPNGRGSLLLTDLDRLDAMLRGGGARTGEPAATIYQTADGGLTWHVAGTAPAGANPRLTPETFVDGATGWLAGGETAWVTADGGRSWRVAGRVPSGWTFAALVPVSRTVAVAQVQTGPSSPLGGFPSKLVLTTDGGRSWHAVQGPPAP